MLDDHIVKTQTVTAKFFYITCKYVSGLKRLKFEHITIFKTEIPCGWVTDRASPRGLVSIGSNFTINES